MLMPIKVEARSRILAKPNLFTRRNHSLKKSAAFNLKGLLDNLLQPCGEWTTEKSTQQRHVARDMNLLSIDPHFHPKPVSIQSNPVVVI
jgi:hypothetical protein